ncbi:MAG: BtrH N-terminal domain-containing protein [Clostridia bacterium]|nr:BtrH N-terminal domain-containing protein [Clostridia bacterium]
MMGKKIIENLEPFKEFFFQDCIYNAVFSVINHYNKSILPILINTYVHYTYSENNTLNISFDYRSDEKFEKLLNKLGMRIEGFSTTDSFASDIKEAIDREVPVIVNVDCFYESIRKDTYHREHLDHSLLVYGYEGGDFWIYEHSNRNALNYKPAKISQGDLLTACNGYVDRYMKESDQPYAFYCICEDSGWKSANQTFNAEYIKKYVGRFMCEAEESLFGMKNYYHAISELGKILRDYDKLSLLSSELIKFINNVIHIKKAQQYILKHFAKEPEKAAAEISSSWTYARLLLSRCIEEADNFEKNSEAAIDAVKKAWDRELELNDLIKKYAEDLIKA